MKIYKEALLKMLKKIKLFVKENYKFLIDVFYFILLIIAVINLKDQNKNLWLIVLVVVYTILHLILLYFDSVKEVQHPKIRYTRKNENGDIIVEEEKLHQALIYLSILEDRIEGR